MGLKFALETSIYYIILIWSSLYLLYANGSAQKYPIFACFLAIVFLFNSLIFLAIDFDLSHFLLLHNQIDVV